MSGPLGSPTFAKVVGRLALTVGDGSDEDDLPEDLYPDPTSTATFIPQISVLKSYDAQGRPVTRVPAAVTAGFDATGNLTYRGKPYVMLLDLGGPGVNPVIPRDETAWKLQFHISVGGKSVVFPDISLNPDGSLPEVDFTDWVKLKSPTGAAIVQGKSGTGIESLALTPDGMGLVAVMTDGTTKQTALPVVLAEADAQVAAVVADTGATRAALDVVITEHVDQSPFVARVWDGAAWPGRESDDVVHWIDPLGTSTPPAEARLGDIYTSAK